MRAGTLAHLLLQPCLHGGGAAQPAVSGPVLAFGRPAPRPGPWVSLRCAAPLLPCLLRAVDGTVPATNEEIEIMTNIVLLVGNLGGDPELRSTNGGTDVASFSLGTSRPKRDSEGKTYKDESGFTAKDTEWHRVTCFNGLGRVVSQHAAKGMLVSVRGRIHNSKWTDKEGIGRFGYEIIADDVQFLGRPRQQAGTDEPVEEGSDLPLD